MPRTTRNKNNNMNETITPLYVLAGAGDLAVEKIREISKMASSRISSLETTDPAEVSDRMQVRIEEGADTLGVVLRSASSDIREQAKGISGRAQSAMQAMWMSAGDAYDDLIERGEGVMSHLRGQNGRTIQRTAAGARGGRTTAAKKASRPATKATGTKAAGTKTAGAKATGTKSTAKKSASKTASRSATKTASKSTRSASKSTTRKRAATKRANSSGSANGRKSTTSASKAAPAGAARPATSNTTTGTTASTASAPTTNSSTSSTS